MDLKSRVKNISQVQHECCAQTLFVTCFIIIEQRSQPNYSYVVIIESSLP
jgi:hypothetical protein